MGYAKWQERAKANKKWMREYKLAHGCANCGYNAHAEALDFHHKDSDTKLFDVGTSKTRRVKSLLAEMEKCEVLCANCHRVKTHAESKVIRAKKNAKPDDQRWLPLAFTPN